MGAWGGGLYDSDFARDLKGTINGVLRAPLSDEEVLAEIWASHGEGAVAADALDYWLVLADQLERRGIRRQDVFERAIAIVEAGEVVAMLEQLEAEPKTIAERRKETAKLVERLRDPRPAKPRRPLKTPQPLLLEPGEALTWPTDRGDSINRMFPRIRSGSSAASPRTAGLRDRHRGRPPLPCARVLRGAGAEMAPGRAAVARACGALPALGPPLRHDQ
jgi:hypothetical protein